MWLPVGVQFQEHILFWVTKWLMLLCCLLQRTQLVIWWITNSCRNTTMSKHNSRGFGVIYTKLISTLYHICNLTTIATSWIVFVNIGGTFCTNSTFQIHVPAFQHKKSNTLSAIRSMTKLYNKIQAWICIFIVYQLHWTHFYVFLHIVALHTTCIQYVLWQD